MVSDGIDLFSGARGWEARAHRSLGLDLLGIEWWEPANRTSRAAGLRTLQADIAALNPTDHAGELAAAGARLLVGSPPCPTFSGAGNGSGRHLTAILVQCLRDLAAGRDTRAETQDAAFAVLSPIAWATEQARAKKAKREPDRAKSDERARRDAAMSVLVVEPLRWALALRPRAIVLEQVPDVLAFWKVIGGILAALGYSWWAGVLEAERFGVPQTRERAILIARNDGLAAHPPEPTHHRFVPNEPRPQDEHGLFGEIKSWVSMAEALGWDDGRAYELARGEGMTERHGERRAVPKTEPAPTISTKARTADWVMRSGQTVAGGEHARRDGDEPAVTITGRADLNQWQMRANAQANASVRDADEPAPTIKGGHDTADRVWTTERPASTEALRADGWPDRRPATTVAGDARVFPPGGHHIDGDQSKGAIRVTVEEAAALQSFPPDWPWAGDGEKPNTRTAQFTMVGNAVPPLLGECVLRTVLPAERWKPDPSPPSL